MRENNIKTNPVRSFLMLKQDSFFISYFPDTIMNDDLLFTAQFIFW